MSSKGPRIRDLTSHLAGGALDPRYLGFFECFNREEFFESHEVLEDLWLAERQSPNHAFYKGLIQLAGAFVHLQKNRLRPAAALFQLSRTNLEKYPEQHEALDLRELLSAIRDWLHALESTNFSENPFPKKAPPKFHPQTPPKT